MSARPILHLIDGSGYIFRAYYAIRPLSTRDGTPTHAVMGFAKMLLKLLREQKPTYLGIAFDTGKDNFRHALYPNYKANRDAPPEDLVPQFALIHELVAAMRLPMLLEDGFEADDLLATLATQAIAAGYDVVLVTGDKDLMQLVGDHLTLYDPLKDKLYDRAAVIEKFGVGPEHVADILALAGDTSDNIPGVPRVGPKSAAKLVAQYGDVEAVIAGVAGQAKRKAFEQAVVDFADQARLCKKLTVLEHNAPVTFDREALTYLQPDAQVLRALLVRLEAEGLMRDFGLAETAGPVPTGDQALAGVQPLHLPDAALPQPQSLDPDAPLPEALRALGTENPDRPVDRDGYRMVRAMSEVDEIVAACRRTGCMSVDLETTSLYAAQADIVGISVAVPAMTTAYIPIAHHYLGVPKQLLLADVLRRLRPVLEDARVVKVGMNLKYDSIVFDRAGIALKGIAHDCMLAAYVLDSGKMAYGMDALAKEHLGHQNITYDEVTGKGAKRVSFAEVPVETATRYAGEDSDIALRLCQKLGRAVHQSAMYPIYRDIEMPLLPVLAAMEAHGVMLDLGVLEGLSKEFNERLRIIEDRAHAEIGSPINLGSPKQLAELFFNKLGYEPVKKTKTGFSTDQDVLEILARKHTLPGIILEHRVLTKLKGTYIDALPKMVNKDTGRVHTSFNQTGTATGRLSSSDPNLQNIPIRNDDGRRIRAAFICPEGYRIISADYSQIELRIMAHLCQDPDFIDAFRQGEDIHQRTAKEILAGGQTPTPEMRRRAKAINFGILYGLSEFGLARQLDISRGEAHAYISAYFGRYPRIRGFLDATIERGKETGYVETLLGRRRFLPNLRSANGTIRAGAERIAMNTPIQGSAADLIKLAMLRVQGELLARKLKTRLLLQVHDELVLEAPEDEVETVSDMLRKEMSGVWQLDVPLNVEVGVGPNWAEAH